MLCYNYTFNHDLYECTNKKSLLEPCLILVYFLLSTGYSELKKNLNIIIKIRRIADTTNFILEYFILYIKVESFLKNYKNVPIFFEYYKLPWELNILALIAINIVLTIDGGCHVTYFKPLLYLIMTLHPSLGLNYIVIKQAATIGIFLLALNVKYKTINKLFKYNIESYTKLKTLIEILYYISQQIITGLLSHSITDDIKITILVFLLPFKEYTNKL